MATPGALPPDRHGLTPADIALDTRGDAVAGKGKRKRRKRTARATEIRRFRGRINETWTDIVSAYKPNGDVVELPGLYEDRRAQRAELHGLSAGTPVARLVDPAVGDIRTSATK